MTGYIILGVLLALSAAGNAWQFHHGEVLLKVGAATEQLATDTKAAAQACSQGVEDLDKAGKTRQASLLAALKGVAPRVASLQAEALKAAQAKPDDPKDLCGSLTRYLNIQIQAEKKAKGVP